MTTTTLRLPAKTTRAQLMVGESATILKRFYLIQRELVLMQAGWMPNTAHWERKLLLPEFLWQDALVARELRQRVLELRYPERNIDVGQDDVLIRMVRAFRDAPDELDFVWGLRYALKPKLHEAYQRYLQIMDPLDDAPTTRILRQALSDIDEQYTRWDAVLDGAASERAQTLAQAMGDLLATTAAQSMPDCATQHPPFQIARYGARDPRFKQVRFYWPDALDRSFGAGSGLQLQVRQGVHHLNEVWAAEMAAACIFDLVEEADAEFLFDAARWCFDEIRHCRMGYTRLGEWGFEMGEMPLGSFQYDAGARCDALTRLGIIFFFESTYIHTKPERAKIFGEWGDRVSSHDMDFDWADEQIHTHYGTRWLKYFLELRNDTRRPVDFRIQAEAAVKAEQMSATEEDKWDVQFVFSEMMARATAWAADQL